MELIKVAVAFVVIMVVLNLHQPLFLAMLAGALVLLPLFGIGLPEFCVIAWKSVTSWSTIQVAIAFYVIAMLQYCLRQRNHLTHAQEAMSGLSRDKRLNAALASVFIGMLPAAPAVIICGEMIDEMAGDHLKPAEKAAVASFYRHIPEGVLPTYTQIIIACTLSGVAVSAFVTSILPMALVLVCIGFMFYLRKVPLAKHDGAVHAGKADSLKTLLRSLWTIFAAILVIVIFNLDAWLVVAVIVVINFFVDKFTPKEIAAGLTKCLPLPMFLSTFATFIFKDVLMRTGVVDVMPDYFAKLPIPAFLAMALLFFFGTLVASSNAVTSAFIPLAFSTIPGASVPLLVLLMGFSYAASQISPVHICISIVSEHFHVSLAAFIRRMLPMVLTYAVILVGYYLLLTTIGL